MSTLLTKSERPIAKGSYKTVYKAEPTSGLEPAIFNTNMDYKDLVIVVIPINTLSMLNEIYDEYVLHQKFVDHGLAPQIYGFTLIHKPLQNKMIKIAPEVLFSEGSFHKVVRKYIQKVPQLESAAKNIYAIAVLEDRCAMVKWQRITNPEILSDSIYSICDLLEATIDMGYIFLDAKLINLCPNKDFSKIKAIDFDAQFVKQYNLFFHENGEKYAFLFMAIMIYTDFLRYLNEPMRNALNDCFELMFLLKNIKQTDIRNMVNTCYETCCENISPEKELPYNPLNMIYFYKIDKEPNVNNKVMRTCEQMHNGVKEEIIDYLLQVTVPLFS